VQIASAPARAQRDTVSSATATDAPVLRIGVHPARERAARKRLLGALEQVHQVRFEARDAGDWADLDGVLCFGGEPLELPLGLPALRAISEERRLGSGGALALQRREELERPLRGAALTDSWSAALAGDAVRTDDLVLATSDGQPAWIASAGTTVRTVVSTAPAELAAGEALRERLAPGRCLALLSLVHFLRSLAPQARRPPPMLRAAFVIDDPNLHWPSYGHIRYEALQQHAHLHGYHVSIAMVPLDGWLAHPRVVRLFQRHADRTACWREASRRSARRARTPGSTGDPLDRRWPHRPSVARSPPGAAARSSPADCRCSCAPASTPRVRISSCVHSSASR